uniref:Uncharacterized protein n=1 Tax=virus sp. ctQmo6 TaxID=2827990 RepID=A0A8S5RFH3_9VIRU|nr:MAG TPA: hypothetical protein [virus sp. ctQmo6]
MSYFMVWYSFAVYLIPPIKCYQRVPIIKCLTSDIITCIVLLFT